MARREVVEIVCDRCNRTETQAPGSVAKRDGMNFEFTVNFHGKQVQYEDLCRRCRSSLSNYYDKIIKAKDDEPLKAEEKPAQATSVAPTPPPKTGGLFSRSKAAG
jgi:NMD protein affecting ribosome stability and mRNA decay